MSFPGWRHSLERLLVTLWVGGLWAIGYMVAPALFSHLPDRRVAGEIAGSLFHLINGVGLICGLALLILLLEQSRKGFLRHWRFWLLMLMVVLTAVLFFYVQPLMQELKQQPMVTGSAVARSFGIWHGISSLMYLMVSIAGLMLVLAGIRKPTAV